MTQPKLARTSGRGRVYRWADGEYDSVTQILGNGIAKPALKSWGEKMVAEAAYNERESWVGKMNKTQAVDYLKKAPFRNTERASVRGSAIHDWSEKWALGIEVPIEQLPDEQRPIAEGYLEFLRDWNPKYLMTEATVFSRRFGYAGTLDAMVEIEVENLGVTLLDTKTKAEKAKAKVYPENVLQLAAYRYSDFIALPDGVGEEPMVPVESVCVLLLFPGGYRLVPVHADEVAFRYFRYAQQMANFTEGGAGAAMVEPPLIHPSKRGVRRAEVPLPEEAPWA